MMSWVIAFIKQLNKVIAAILFTTAILHAQQDWSLQQCITYALDHNLKIRDLQYARASAEETFQQTRRNFLPSVNGGMDYNIRFGRSINPNDNSIINSNFYSNNYYVNGDVDLFDGFKKINLHRASKFMFLASGKDIEQQRFLLSFRVINAYYDMVYFSELNGISQEQLEISQTNYDLIKRQIDIGVKAVADLYEAESTLLRDQFVLTQGQNRLKESKLNLMQEMNYPLADSLSVDLETDIDEYMTSVVERTDSIYAKAKDNVPQLTAQKLRISGLKKEAKATRGDYLPTLSLFASSGTGFYETNVDATNRTKPFANQLDENLSSRIGVSLSIPIFNKGQVKSRIKQQEISVARAQNELTLQEQTLFGEVKRLVQENTALMVEIQKSQKQIVAQKEAFRVAQKKYEKGLITILDLTSAKNAYAASQGENLQVRLKLLINRSTLDFYKGVSYINAIIKE